MFRRRPRTEEPRRGVLGTLGRILRTIVLAILVAFLFGFVVGTLLRRGMDEPVRYMGGPPTYDSVDSLPTAGSA